MQTYFANDPAARISVLDCLVKHNNPTQVALMRDHIAKFFNVGSGDLLPLAQEFDQANATEFVALCNHALYTRELLEAEIAEYERSQDDEPETSNELLAWRCRKCSTFVKMAPEYPGVTCPDCGSRCFGDEPDLEAHALDNLDDYNLTGSFEIDSMFDYAE